MPVVAVEEASLLLAMGGIVGGVQIDPDLLPGSLMGLKEALDEQTIHPLGIGDDLLVARRGVVTLRSKWRRFRRSVACSVTRTSAKHCATTSDLFFSLAGPLAFCGVFRSVFPWGALGTERAMLAALPELSCHGSCNGEGRWACNVTGVGIGGRELQAIEGARAGQGLALVALAQPILTGGVFLAHHERQ